MPVDKLLMKSLIVDIYKVLFGSRRDRQSSAKIRKDPYCGKISLAFLAIPIVPKVFGIGILHPLREIIRMTMEEY